MNKPLSPEEFFALHVDTDLSARLDFDDVVKALGDYRDHIMKTMEPQGFHDGAVPPVKDPLQEQYDGYVTGTKR